MSDRRLESRLRTPDGQVTGEWEPVTDVDTWGWDAKKFREFVKITNAANKARGEWIQYRSVENEDAFA